MLKLLIMEKKNDISLAARYLEYLTLISFLNRGKNESILVAFQNPKLKVLKNLLKEPNALIDLESGKLKEPLKLIKLDEFKEMLKPDFIPFLVVDDLDKFSVLFYDFLPNPIFLWAIKKSEEFVGCSGDDSFARVLSMGKVPLYHALTHKMDFSNAFVKFIGSQGLNSLRTIFDNFIHMRSANMEKRYYDKLKSINLAELQKEIEKFKTETVPKIKSEYSLFDRIYDSLYKGKEEQLVEGEVDIFNDAQETLALKSFKEFQRGSLEGLADIFELYFSFYLHQKSFELMEDKGYYEKSIFTFYNDPSVKNQYDAFNEFVQFVLKRENKDLKSLSFDSILTEDNTVLFNEQFKDKFGDPILGPPVPIEKESIQNYIQINVEKGYYDRDSFQELTGYGVCCYILRYLRVSNCTDLHQLDNLIIDSIDQNSLKITCGNIINKTLSSKEGSSPLYVTFKELANYVNSLLPDELKFSIDDLMKERNSVNRTLNCPGMISPKRANEVLKFLISEMSSREYQDLDKLIPNFESCYSKKQSEILELLGVQFWKFKKEKLNTAIKNFYYCTDSEEFKREIKRLLNDNSAVILEKNKLSFKEFIQLIKTIKEKCNDASDVGKLAQEIVAEFMK